MVSSNKISTAIALLLLFVFSSCGQAQNRVNCPTPRAVDDSSLFVPVDTSYSFINYNANHLLFFGDSSQMQRFAHKFYTLLRNGQGNVNIMQIGASHVQGGTFPHQLRRNILLGATRSIECREQGFPIASRGMIFPYSAAIKCNNPYDYKVSRSHPLTLTRNVYKEPDQQLGLCGIAVTAADSNAEIGITLTEPDIDFATRSIVLLGQSYGGVVPLIKIVRPSADSLMLSPASIDTSLRRYTYQFPEPVDSFRIILPCDSGQAFALTGLLLQSHRSGITFHSIGVNGASTSDYLTKCPFLTSDLRLCPPDLVIFGIGINDAAGPNFDTAIFRQRYLSLVDSIRSVSPDCAFIFITNNDSYRRVKRHYSVNNNGPLVREAFFRIAQQCGGMVWDQFTIMGGLSSMSRWNAESLAQRDKVHFTRRGYQLLADLLHNAIVESLVHFKPQETPASSTDSTQQAQKRPQPTFPKKRKNTTNERPNYVFE